MTDHILFSHEKRFERSAKDIHKNKHFVSSKLGESFSCDMAYNEAVESLNNSTAFVDFRCVWTAASAWNLW